MQQIRRSASIKTYKGFTLIELMIVVVIIALLAAVALPAYQDSVRSSRRAEARNALMSAQLEQEKYRGNHSTYGDMAGIGVSATTPNGYYTIAVDSAGATSFLMTATPVSGTSQASDACGTFAVNQMGPDTSTGYASSECW